MNNFRACLAAALATMTLPLSAADTPAHFQRLISETQYEFTGTGDFDGDGRLDAVVLDKSTGRYRLGFQTSPGTFRWIFVRNCGIETVSGLSIGKLLKTTADALAVTSPDANKINVIDASDLNTPPEPLSFLPVSIGPSTLIALDLPNAGAAGFDDIYVNTIYNSPDENRLNLMQNTSGKLVGLADLKLEAPVLRGNRLTLAGKTFAAVMVTGEGADTFRLESVSTSAVQTALSIGELPSGADYAIGFLPGVALPQFAFYEIGGSNVLLRTLQSAGDNKWSVANAASHSLGRPIKQLVGVTLANGSGLLAIFGEGDIAALYRWDAGKAPVEVQKFNAPPGENFSGAIVFPDSFFLLSGQMGVKFSANYQTYKLEEDKAVAGIFASLGTLDENVIRIHKRLVANTQITTEPEMKAYTNTIPGTQVTYVMLPIPSGEYLMGTAESEAGRKPDESPQHKVKVSPFWMGRCEVTWNEFELFMYPDEERKYKDTLPTDPEVDKLSDAVTRPTKPYTEMSFGMGKDGFPAISMTQHAANKYCEWLSAKTGEFYRLPTEAEWEYACRAGTTTVYSFGDDPAQLDQYAWFEANSDLKYQKVGKKKPNPWGLYDMHGNVVEWCLDQYIPSYAAFTEPVTVDPWTKATKPYPHVVRGGSWDDDAVRLRSGARRGSDRAWKMQDPQLPKSVWYHSDAQWVGFRVVRPLKVPPPEDLFKYWTSGVERD